MGDDAEIVNKASPGDAPPAAGHNGGPRMRKLTAKQKVERIKEVLDMEKMTAAQKCVGVAIICEADTDWVTPELSTADLQRYASVKDRETVYRATETLGKRRITSPIKSEGKANRYIVLPSIDAAIDDMDSPTGRVSADHTGRVRPDRVVGSNPTGPPPRYPSGSTAPVGSTPVGSNPTGVPQDAGAPTCGRAQFEFPSGIDSIPKKASQLDREPDVDGERLAGLNGSADQMIDDLLIWMGHRSTPYNARQWLAQMVHTFGADVIAQSYAKLQTDLVTGAVIAKPMQTWSSIAQRMKAQPATRPKSFLENLTKMAAEAEERMARK